MMQLVLGQDATCIYKRKVGTYLYVAIHALASMPSAPRLSGCNLYKKSRHAANMKAGRVVQASVMLGCYEQLVCIRKSR
jgi:hypothetical protein